MNTYLVTVKWPKDNKFIRKALVNEINEKHAISKVFLELEKLNLVCMLDTYKVILYKNQSLKAKHLLDLRNTNEKCIS